MKPTIISPKTKKTEIIVLSCCIIAAFILNALSILIFDTSWKELFTQVPVVLILGIFFYMVILVIRIIASFLKRIVAK